MEESSTSTMIQILALCICQTISFRSQDSSQNQDVRILVLGAGMSGINAAKTLHDAGYQNITIIEATSRVGGRIKDTKLGDYTVELGAMWVYGKGTNPVYQITKEANMSLAEDIKDEWTVRDETGDDATEEADIAFTNVSDTFTRANMLLEKARADYTVTAALRNSNWRPQTEVEDAIEAYMFQFETGVTPELLSLRHLNLNSIFIDFGNFDLMPVRHSTGYAEVVEQLRNRFLGKHDSRLVFNKTVKVIKHGPDGVQVFTADGGTFEADFVVVTFSLGVLQQREVKFDPPLPKKKQLAIDMFGICRFTHLYIQFPYTFWDNTTLILRASKVRGHYSFWGNINMIYPGSNILQLSLFGDDSTWVDRSTDEVVSQKLLSILASLYPNVTIPVPSDLKISRWNTDPLTRGAFSYWPFGFDNQDMKQLQAPVGRVFFAGEHLDPRHYGFVTGAYLSGQRTARDMIRCLKRPKCAGYRG